jgi:type IV secretion system protein VirB9
MLADQRSACRRSIAAIWNPTMRLCLYASLILVLSGGVAIADEATSPLAPEKVAASRTLPYGQGTPTITCAPAHYCALALQQGETIQKVDEPDHKWTVTPTTYGAGQFATPMLILSPSAADLSSDLTVTTDRRTYTLKLLGSATESTSLTAFSYPNP